MLLFGLRRVEHGRALDLAEVTSVESLGSGGSSRATSSKAPTKFVIRAVKRHVQAAADSASDADKWVEALRVHMRAGLVLQQRLEGEEGVSSQRSQWSIDGSSRDDDAASRSMRDDGSSGYGVGVGERVSGVL